MSRNAALIEQGWYSGKQQVIGYAITGKEFVAMEDLARLGIEHWRGVRIEFERRGKQRTAEAHEHPAIHNYIWMALEPHQLILLSRVRFLGSTLKFLDRREVSALHEFRGEVETREAEGRALIAERQRILDEAKAIAALKAEIAAQTEAQRRADAAALSKRMAAYRTAVAAFKHGEIIEIRDGALAGALATFRRMVQTSHDLFPRIQADMEVMGRVVPVDLDPLDVRRVG